MLCVFIRILLLVMVEYCVNAKDKIDILELLETETLEISVSVRELNVTVLVTDFTKL